MCASQVSSRPSFSPGIHLHLEHVLDEFGYWCHRREVAWLGRLTRGVASLDAFSRRAARSRLLSTKDDATTEDHVNEMEALLQNT